MFFSQEDKKSNDRMLFSTTSGLLKKQMKI